MTYKCKNCKVGETDKTTFSSLSNDKDVVTIIHNDVIIATIQANTEHKHY